MPLDRLDLTGLTDDDQRADEPLPEQPIEPGDPAPENALFVLLGVLVALAVVARLVVLFG